MPFTIGGDYIPNEPKKDAGTPKNKSKKPVKVRLQKRGQVLVTTVLNLDRDAEELKAIAKDLKRCCGSGGTVKNAVIEIQGDHVQKVQQELRQRGIKAQ